MQGSAKFCLIYHSHVGCSSVSSPRIGARSSNTLSLKPLALSRCARLLLRILLLLHSLLYAYPTYIHPCWPQFPTTLSYDEAATIPLCYNTAALGLYGTYSFTIHGMSHRGIGLDIPVGEGAGKYKDEPILITGGASSVGQYGASTILIPVRKTSFSDSTCIVSLQPYNWRNYQGSTPS